MVEENVKLVRLQMRRNSSEFWRINPQFVPLAGEIIVYTDYQFVDGHYKPAIKIGDGRTAIVSLPFLFGSEISSDIMDALNEHVSDQSKHVTEHERNFWNNKLNYRMEGENLIFTTE